MQFAATLVIIAVTMWLLVREVDVRLVLFGAGLALASLALHPVVVFDVFLAEMGNSKTMGPICTAMGYAYVLRATGCDRAMVRLLLAPVRRVRWLLIPGGCAVGFITNIAITSQTGAAAAVGPILVPVMIAAGYSPLIAAATLVLGCSGGGSLYNPGDADLVAINLASRAPMNLVLNAMFLPLLCGFTTAVAVFTFSSNRDLAAAVTPPAESDANATAAEPRWKALLPPLPVVAIFLMLPGVFFRSLPPPFENGLPVSHAMIASTIVVLLLCRDEVSKRVKSFFEGMGYAYANIISLIVTASCFIAGMTEVGLTDRFVKLVSGVGWVSKLLAGFFPGLLGVITGSGMGPSIAFSKAVLPALRDTNLPAALDLGALGAISASFGRTMSPVAAVVIFSATTFGNAPTMALIKRTAPPLLAGFVVALLVVMFRS
jgi:DcuC family C4-dicarboxylate transporter